MFVAYIKGCGEGCDYTIGCNHSFVKIPESVTTFAQAEEWAIGRFEYHGGEERVASIEIFEVSELRKVNLDSVIREKKRRESECEKEKRRKEFERLKEEFGTG